MTTLPTQPFGPDAVPVSRIALGCMGLAGTWNPAEVGPEHRRKAIAAFETALEAGITFYDHADIYGGTACESIFKDCLAAVPGSREKIFIATKVGIRSGYYEHSPDYIRQSLRGSLDRMGLDYVDLYQLHRPDPLSHPAETAAVLDELVEQGLVKTVGVSNYYPHQTLALQKYLKRLSFPTRSPFRSCASTRSTRARRAVERPARPPPATRATAFWISARSWASRPWPTAHWAAAGCRAAAKPRADTAPAVKRTLDALREMAPAYGDATPGQLALAWLLAHPAKIHPLVGSNNPDHIREAAGAASLTLSRTDWYKLWVAARGKRVP